MKFSEYRKKRLAVSPVIATLLLIAIAVAAAIIVYAFVTGLIGGLTNGGSSSLVTLTGSISVPNGIGSGVAVLTIRNTANSPITTVTINSVTPGGTMSAITALVPLYGAAAVSPTNPIPIGGSASGSFSFVTGGTSGTGYTLTVTILFSNGSNQVQTLDVTAQI